MLVIHGREVGRRPAFEYVCCCCCCCCCLHIINHPGLSTQYLLLSQSLRTNPTLDSADFRGHRLTYLKKVYHKMDPMYIHKLHAPTQAEPESLRITTTHPQNRKKLKQMTHARTRARPRGGAVHPSASALCPDRTQHVYLLQHSSANERMYPGHEVAAGRKKRRGGVAPPPAAGWKEFSCYWSRATFTPLPATFLRPLHRRQGAG